MKKIYITGINGMLGKSLEKILRKNNKIYGCDIVKNNYSQIDITNKKELQKDVEKANPDIIIHCAAVIDIDECEKNKEMTNKINVLGTKNICDLAKNKKVIYISTNAVYEGKKGKYKEGETENQKNEYAKSKHLAEKEIAKLKNHVIIRTNIFGKNENNFINWLIGKLLEGNYFKLYTDIISNFIFTDDLSLIIRDVFLESKITGIYNVACEEAISKYGFGMLLCELYGYNNKMIKKACNEFKVKRPLDISMDMSKIKKHYALPSLRESINNYKMGK